MAVRDHEDPVQSTDLVTEIADPGGRFAEWAVAVGDFAPPVAAEPLTGGRSNPSFVLTDVTGTRRLLRMPPVGTVLATAHDVLREARIMHALATTRVPVPRIHATSDDVSILGAPFVVAEFVDGPVLRNSDAALAASSRCRTAAGHRLVEALAELHALDPEHLGLADLIRPGDYVERQVRRWSRQVSAGGTAHRDALLGLAARVAAAVPAQQRVALVHGDPKLDNCILSPAGDVRAIVDWELAAVGDPVADLALMLAYWAEPGDVEFALQDPPSRVSGFATRAELVARYATVAGEEPKRVGAYLAFCYWKLACIVAGVADRTEAGGSPPAVAAALPFHVQVERLQRLARAALEDTIDP